MRIISTISLVVSAAAFLFSLYMARYQADVLKKSKQPLMLVAYYYNNDGSGFRLGNVGVGPAYLRWFQILVDNNPKSSWEEMSTDLNIFGQFDFTRPGPVYHEKDNSQILWIRPGPNDTLLRERNKRVDFRLCYCSIFDECWTVTRNETPKPNSTKCTPVPSVRYGVFVDP